MRDRDNRGRFVRVSAEPSVLALLVLSTAIVAVIKHCERESEPLVLSAPRFVSQPTDGGSDAHAPVRRHRR